MPIASWAVIWCYCRLLQKNINEFNVVCTCFVYVSRPSTKALQSKDFVLLHGHSAAVYSVCYLHSSPFLLSASADKTGSDSFNHYHPVPVAVSLLWHTVTVAFFVPCRNILTYLLTYIDDLKNITRLKLIVSKLQVGSHLYSVLFNSAYSLELLLYGPHPHK